MTAFEWSLMGASAIFVLAGFFLLFLCWKQPARPALLVSGWALLVAAVIAAFVSNGDRGVAQAAVIAVALAGGWFAVPLTRGITPPRARQKLRQAQQVQAVRRPWRAGLSGVWTFLLCGPLAGGAALFASAGLFRILKPGEGSPATAGITSVIVAVLLWAVLSVLFLIEPRPSRRSAYAGTALLAAATAAFI